MQADIFPHLEISAIGLGSFYTNSVGFVLGIGLLGGIDTICSQAYGGKQYYVIGIFVNIARLCLFGFSIVYIIPLVFCCEKILILFKIGTENIVPTSAYVKSLIPYIIFALQYNTNARYLQSMNKNIPVMIISGLTTLLHPVWCLLIIQYTSFGIVGIGFAMGFTSLLNFLFSIGYIFYYDPVPGTFFWFNEDCFKVRRIYDFVKLAVPSAITFTADWFGFEIIIFLSSYLDNKSTAACVILFSFISLISAIPLGLSITTSTYLGNSIGAGKGAAAKRYSIVSTVSGCAIIFVVAILIITERNYLPYLYTNDKNVADIVSNVFKIYFFYGVIDAFQIILSGVIKGLGKQRPASIFVIFILYPVTLPLSITLTFLMNYGFEGLWMAELTSVILLSFAYLIIVLSVDWKNIILRTIVRIKIMNEKMHKKGKILELQS